MSATTEKIGEVLKVIDHDCGNYRIGEIWNDPTGMVENHIDKYDEYGYEQMRDYALQMIHAAERRIRLKRTQKHDACSSSA